MSDNKNIDITNENSELLNIEAIYNDIRTKIITARGKMLKHIDTTMTEVYWYVGKILMNYQKILLKQLMVKR